ENQSAGHPAPKLPPERCGYLIAARRPENDLIRVSGISPRRIELVGEIADAEGDPGLVDAWENPFRHVDEGVGVGNRIGVHDDEFIVKIEAIADVTHRRADFERPWRGKRI